MDQFSLEIVPWVCLVGVESLKLIDWEIRNKKYERNGETEREIVREREREAERERDRVRDRENLSKNNKEIEIETEM